MYSEVLQRLALDAGDLTLRFFRRNPDVTAKADGSPVTEADRAAEALILEGLKAHFHTIPVVAEEEIAAGRAPGELGRRFFLVDPLDGTREFVASRADYTVNIALIEDGVPFAGVIYAPAKKLIYWTDGQTAHKGQVEDSIIVGSEEIGVRETPRETPVVVASRSHRSPETDAFCERLGAHHFVSAGSSLKFCLVAEGVADLYPRFGATMQWDTAAGDAILRAAGGRTVTLDGAPLAYGLDTGSATPFENPHFLALGSYAPEDILHK